MGGWPTGVVSFGFEAGADGVFVSGVSSHAPELLHRISSAKAAVLAETDLLHRHFGAVESNWKSDGSRVTAVDLAISANIFGSLSQQFPADQYFSEELTDSGAPLPVTSRYAWILDPIDGTNNYAAGIAHCAIALALLEYGRPVYGVIYDLSRRTLMHGGPGFGLFDGARAARTKSGPPTAQSFIGFHSPSDKRFAPHAQAVAAEFKLRGLGSSTLHLAYVAVGILDGTVDHNVKVWDIAAAVPLVEAGGGSIVFLNGPVFPLTQFNLRMGRIFYVAGSDAMVTRLQQILHPC